MMRNFLANLVFFLHIPVVLFWWGLFLVPVQWWPNRIPFHFYLTLGIIFHQIVWGIMIMPWTGKFRMVCILTTLMQVLRGKNIADPNNYSHSFLVEFFGKIGLKFTHRMATLATWIVLFSIFLQYMFFRLL